MLYHYMGHLGDIVYVILPNFAIRSTIIFIDNCHQVAIRPLYQVTFSRNQAILHSGTFWSLLLTKTKYGTVKS